MDCKILMVIACTILSSSAWSMQSYPQRRGLMRFTRYAPPPIQFQQAPHHHAPHHQALQHPGPHHGIPADTLDVEEVQSRPKRGHGDYHDHDHGHDHRGSAGVTGPVHTFVKTDKNANYKWGVRHHVGDKYAS